MGRADHGRFPCRPAWPEQWLSLTVVRTSMKLARIGLSACRRHLVASTEGLCSVSEQSAAGVDCCQVEVRGGLRGGSGYGSGLRASATSGSNQIFAWPPGPLTWMRTRRPVQPPAGSASTASSSTPSAAANTRNRARDCCCSSTCLASGGSPVAPHQGGVSHERELDVLDVAPGNFAHGAEVYFAHALGGFRSHLYVTEVQVSARQ